MTYLTVAWCLISLPVLLIGADVASDKPKISVRLTASATTFLPLWWGVYFLTRWWLQ